MVDEHGNTLPFANDPVILEASGAVELIGPSVVSLQGGMGGTYVRTVGEAGDGTLTIRTADAAAGQSEGLEETIQFEVR